MTDLMKTKRTARIFSVKESSQFSVLSSQSTLLGLGENQETGVAYKFIGSLRELADECVRRHTSIAGISEGAFLCEGIARERGALRGFGDLYANGGSFGGCNARGTEHRILAENFVVNLGDEIVLAI